MHPSSVPTTRTPKLQSVPFHSSTAEFRAGSDTPSADLERSSLPAPGLAPIGLNSPGTPPWRSSACIWQPCASLPLLAVHALPIGVQVIGFGAATPISPPSRAGFPRPCRNPRSPPCAEAGAVGRGPDPYRT